MAFNEGIKAETKRWLDAAAHSLAEIRQGIIEDNRGRAMKGAEDLKKEAWSINNNVGFMESDTSQASTFGEQTRNRKAE